MEPLRKELAEGVFLTYVPAAKFKTGVLGAQLITPLEESTVAAGALLPAVLRRGTTAHRDMRSIAAELDRLYGASVAYTVRKKGGCSIRWPTCSASCCSTRSRGTGAS